MKPPAFLLAIFWTGWLTAAAEQPGLIDSVDPAAIEREDRMWRLVRPDDDLEGNLRRIERLGAPAEEFERFSARLARLWTPPAPRFYGWLHEEKAVEIAQVDREFLIRARAARLREASGLQTGTRESSAHVAAAWHKAILRVLDYDELAEFRLMNSPSSQKVAQQAKHLVLTDDERRQIFDWQRDFDGLHATGQSLRPADRLEAQLELWTRFRSLIGDGRFVSFLTEASPAFSRIHAVITDDSLHPVTATRALDAWWIWQRATVEQTRTATHRERETTAARARREIEKRIGPENLARLLTLPETKGLNAGSPRLRVVVLPGRPAQDSATSSASDPK